jgi:hypothetical protein
VWTSYSARHAAQLIGLPESAVRSCIRDGLVGTPGAVPAQLSFRDLAALRTVKSLVDAGLPLPRVRKELIALANTLPSGTSFTELTIESHDGHVHVRGTAAPHAGQLALELDPLSRPRPEGELREMPRAPDAPVPVAVPPATAEQWLTRAQALEERDPVAAIDAYRRSLRLRPDSTEAWINLGRLFAEASDAGSAGDCFKSALELDPQLAEAHYNLATLFDQSGDSRSAIRHINEYRKLTR